MTYKYAGWTCHCGTLHTELEDKGCVICDDVACSVGRDIDNEKLPGWDKLCESPAVVDVVIEDARKTPFHFCVKHDVEFRLALNAAAHN